jgi:hypothetical protein
MKYLGVAASLIVAGCASTPAPAPRPAAPPERTAAAFPTRPAIDKRGLEAVMGKDVGTLKRLFGEPRLDVVEVHGRKLQFIGKACVLDAFLYPDGKEGAEIVTHVDARRSDGAAVDRAACVDALQRR